MKSTLFLFSVSLFLTVSFGCGGHLFLPPFPSSVCVCTLTHCSPPRSPWSLGLACGFEAVVKAWGHEEGRGVIMRSSPPLLLPNLPSSPFVSLPFHFHATQLFSSRSTASRLTLTTSPRSLLFSFPTSSSFSPPLNLCDSQSVPHSCLCSPLQGVLCTRGLLSASSSLPSLAHSQGEAGSLTPSLQQEAAAAGVRSVWRCRLALSEVLPSQG